MSFFLLFTWLLQFVWYKKKMQENDIKILRAEEELNYQTQDIGVWTLESSRVRPIIPDLVLRQYFRQRLIQLYLIVIVPCIILHSLLTVLLFSIIYWSHLRKMWLAAFFFLSFLLLLSSPLFIIIILALINYESVIISNYIYMYIYICLCMYICIYTGSRLTTMIKKTGKKV